MSVRRFGSFGTFGAFACSCPSSAFVSLEPARADCTSRLPDHHAGSQSARAHSSQMHVEASGPQCSRPIRSSLLEPIAICSSKATMLDANTLEPARTNCTFKLQGHHSSTISVRARSSRMQFEASGPPCSKSAPTKCSLQLNFRYTPLCKTSDQLAMCM